MKTTVDIPDEMYRKAKIRAVEEGTTLKNLIVSALSSVLSGDMVLKEERSVYKAGSEADADNANTYTAIIKKDGAWWIGWIEEVPGVNCQERSRQALLESLRVTLAEALVLNREEALSMAGSAYTEERVSA